MACTFYLEWFNRCGVFFFQSAPFIGSPCIIGSNQVNIYENIVYTFAFSALTLLVGWQEGHPACGGVLVWLSVWSEMQTCIWPSGCHCHSMSLA